MYNCIHGVIDTYFNTISHRTDHLVDSYQHKNTPNECLTTCEFCTGWDSVPHHPPEATRCEQTHGEEHSRKQSHDHQCVNYNGAVTNHIYNFPLKEEVNSKDPENNTCTKSSKSLARRTAHGHTKIGTQSQRTGVGSSSQKLSARAKTNKENKTSTVQDIGNRLFDDVFPYHHFRKFYHGRTKELIRIVVILYLLYQGMSVMIMSLCENGGLLTAFKAEETDRYTALVCRFVAFTLRFLLRVVTPLCCTLHIPIIASKPSIPRISLSPEQAVLQMIKIHERFSSEEEVTELRGSSLKTVFDQSEEMTKRRIKSIWIPMTNAAFLVAMLLYLGAFLLCESNTIKGGVCSSLGQTILTLPLLNFDIHLIIVVESCSVFIALLLAGIAANCYYYENTISRYATVLGKEASSLHDSVRRRWVVMDMYAILLPFVLAFVTLLSFSTGQPFTPVPRHPLEVNELINWYFWIINLTFLQFLGYSCNRMTKYACLCGYALSIVLVYSVEVDMSLVPYGSILVLLYCGLAALCFNLLYSLCLCHWCHARETGSLYSYTWFVCCVLSLLVSKISLLVTVFREVVHISNHIS